MTVSKWKVDPSHSSIEFSVRHMMITNVKGSFNEFSASIEADPSDLTTAAIEFSVNVASIDTRNKDRDAHLTSADFFNIESYPNISFKSTNILKTDEGEYAVTGDLTINDVTRSETFTAIFEGQGKDPWGNEVVGFSGEGKINRSDYGLTWNAALETGGVLIGDAIKFSIQIEATKEA